ncbi:MAG: hypothetical protein CME21_09215 [Gemmatimonadetes bacterium]|nr:hypothetical protein [Gemmatimonadota bacterium]
MRRILPLFIALVTSVSHAQTPAPVLTDASAFLHQVTIGNGTDEIRYRQIVSPIALSIPITFGNIDIQSAYMRLERRDYAGTEDIHGPMDTQISAEWDLGRALITGYVNLPTGSDSLNADETGLVSGIIRNDLNFPIKTFGQGFDYGGAITVAHRVEQWTFSFGGGYVVRGNYSPFETAADYDPGDELTVTAGAGYSTGGWTFGLDPNGKLIYVDRISGQPTFRNGKQLMVSGSLNYASRFFKINASITEIARFKNRQLVQGTLLYEMDDSNGNDLRARGYVSLTPFTGISLFGEGEYKDVSKNAYDPTDALFLDAARIWSYGGGLSIQLGKTEALTVRAMRGDGWINDRADDVATWNARVAIRLFF